MTAPIAPRANAHTQNRFERSSAVAAPLHFSCGHWQRVYIESLGAHDMADEELPRNEITSYQRILTAQQDRMLRNQDRVEANQARLDKMLEKILTNQALIIASQQRIRDGQNKLDKVITNQGTIIANQQGIQANQEKLDRLLSNQAATIVANQQNIISNQEKLDQIMTNQATIASNQDDRVIPNQEKIMINQELIMQSQQKILVKELVDRLLDSDRSIPILEKAK
jgi:hypothetical protein